MGSGSEYVLDAVPDAHRHPDRGEVEPPWSGERKAVVDPAVDPTGVGGAHPVQVPVFRATRAQSEVVDFREVVVLADLGASLLDGGDASPANRCTRGR